MMQADHLCRVCVEKNALALLEMFSPNAWNGITYLFHHLLLGHLILYNCNIRLAAILPTTHTTIFVETDSMRVGYILLMDKKEGTRKLFY